MPYTYPAPPATLNGTNGDVVEVHRLLQSPTLLARRLRTLAEQRFIADALLTGRYTAVGGAILYETGESIYTQDEPQQVSPGGSYPRSQAGYGPAAAAKTVKWGQDVPVTDEAIARLNIDPVNRALLKLTNQMVKTVDSSALGVIASSLTQTFDVTAAGNPGAWTTGDKIAESVLRAIAKVDALNQGYAIDAIVLNDDQWAKAVSRLFTAGFFPREAGNPLVSGVWPEALGVTWMKTPNMPGSDPLLLDRLQLGGMADEVLNSPGYSRGGDGVGVETKALRDDDLEQYMLRGRRVTVPIVREVNAGIVIDNTGL